MLLFYSSQISDRPPALPFPGRELLKPGGELVLEDALWPLMTVRFGARLNSELFEAYLEARTESLHRQEPHVSIIDARAVSARLAPYRQRYIEWLREHERALRQCLIGSAYVSNSPEGRMLVSLIRHGSSLQTPFVVVPTMPDAADWVAQRLHERGLGDAARRVRAHYALPTG